MSLDMGKLGSSNQPAQMQYLARAVPFSSKLIRPTCYHKNLCELWSDCTSMQAVADICHKNVFYHYVANFFIL